MTPCLYWQYASCKDPLKVSLKGHILQLWLSQVVKISCVVFLDFTQLSSNYGHQFGCAYILEHRGIPGVLLHLLTTVLLISQTSHLQWTIKYDAEPIKLLQNSFSPHYQTHKMHQHGSAHVLICVSKRLPGSSHCWTQLFTRSCVTVGLDLWQCCPKTLGNPS